MNQEPVSTPTLSVARGNPTEEELAAVSVLLAALAQVNQEAEEPQEPAARVTRLRKRRALSTPRLPWNIGRR